MELGYALSGLLVGFIVGLTGVGGGSLMTPMLVMIFGVSPATAVGTDLLYASFTKATGVWVHARRGNVEWKLVGWLAAGSIPAALVALMALHTLGVDSRKVGSLITGVLGFALILTALAILFKERLQSLGKVGAGSAWRERHVVPATIATGAVIGALVALSSVGAGAVRGGGVVLAVSAVARVAYRGQRYRARGSADCRGRLGHFYMGSVDWHLLGNLLIGSLPGIYLGSQLSGRIAERWLRPALASMLVLVGGKLVW